ncbi:NAD(P)H-binding protein [Lapidilactobacillus bayanensis]|uniref:NAD(P)H-binding protein n=1 Tax=Lapidilactobacillus bayanensis TaxID=2485998 RepID=UPI000F7A58BE|nr:NAD(P)H-binding protein [Lapidilactobacillus bayanensis]
MKYAITAATGKFGTIAVQKLLQLVNENDQVIAIVRNFAKAQQVLPSEVILREADYNDEQSMTSALQGVDHVLFISSQPGGSLPRSEQQRNVVKALTQAKVKFVAYTSFPHAQTAVDSLAADHKLTEDLIVESGIAHAFLRNNWYLENEIGFLQSGQQNQTAAYWAGHQAGWALEREYAEAAAKVLTMEKPQQVYEFAGPANSYPDLGAALQRATDQQVSVKQVTRNQYIEGLVATGLDKATATMFASFQEPIDDGALQEETVDLPKVLGHNLTSLPEAIKEILKRN